MLDVEFRVVSDRREGLLLALGQCVIANGFTLLRQRVASTAEGAVLTMLVRGPDSRLPQLEESVGAHPMVRRFETNRGEGAAPKAAPTADTTPESGDDASRVEALLPQLAREYPNLFIQLLALEHDLPPEQREPMLRYVGQRVGAWVYKRDFALGGHLPLGEAVRRIALPALRQLLRADMEHDALVVANSPFVHRGEPGACCHFLRGMLGGLLAQHGAGEVTVEETQCRNTGASACRFEFHG